MADKRIISLEATGYVLIGDNLGTFLKFDDKMLGVYETEDDKC